MRFILAPEYHQQMLAQPHHTPDCYVRPGEYLHHLYVEGVKYVIAPALLECLAEAQQRGDAEAIRHLSMHKYHFDALVEDARRRGTLDGAVLLGDPPPDDDEGDPVKVSGYAPQQPRTPEETGLSMPFLYECVLRCIYNRGRVTGSDMSDYLKLPFSVLAPVLPVMRRGGLIDITGQRGGGGDAAYEYELKPPKGQQAVEDALQKTAYSGPAPVPFDDYVEAVMAQTIKKLVVTRRSIQRAFQDLIITDAVFNEIGPAINSAASIFLFGFPGNGKTSVAERITRLMGDDIYIPYAIEANGEIIKVFDPIVHTPIQADVTDGVEGLGGLMKGQQHDERFIRVKRPTIVVGGELILPQLDLKYNEVGKFYEAPFQMKANGGIFMIDDFGRQQVRPMDLLNRWIVPLEKKYDYLTTITGTKMEVPFDQLLIFSTNLDPNQLADEAFLRRIKFKIEIRDPDEAQWRQIWRLVCRGRQVEYDDKGIDYLVEKWYKPVNRPFRMCHPRDILDQMISISKYNMERVTFNPDLIDAGCATYFVSQEQRNFGAKVRID
jgi:hypothetical protein